MEPRGLGEKSYVYSVAPAGLIPLPISVRWFAPPANLQQPSGLSMRSAPCCSVCRAAKIETAASLLPRAQEVFDPANRNDDPIRPMIQLVTDFVDRFVEQICFEEHMQISFPLRDKGGSPGRLEIALQENARHLPIPEIGPAFQE